MQLGIKKEHVIGGNLVAVVRSQLGTSDIQLSNNVYST
jgi:hypothetical protein